MSRRALGLVSLSLALTGCSFIGRATLMPTVDTNGVVGVEAKLTGALGLTTQFDHEKSQGGAIGLIALPASLVGAVGERRGSSTELGFDAGAEYALVGRERGNLGFRAGASFSERFAPSGSAPPIAGTTVSTAMLFTVSASGSSTGVVAESRKRIALGPCIDATVLGREQYQRGQVGAGISIDWYDLTQWTVR